jgi:hypothetical protein
LGIKKSKYCTLKHLEETFRIYRVYDIRCWFVVCLLKVLRCETQCLFFFYVLLKILTKKVWSCRKIVVLLWCERSGIHKWGQWNFFWIFLAKSLRISIICIIFAL